jgi:hypothetical protein
MISIFCYTDGMDNCPSEAGECLSLVQSDENQVARTSSACPCFPSGITFLVAFHGQTKFVRATKYLVLVVFLFFQL